MEPTNESSKPNQIMGEDSGGGHAVAHTAVVATSSGINQNNFPVGQLRKIGSDEQLAAPAPAYVRECWRKRGLCEGR